MLRGNYTARIDVKGRLKVANVIPAADRREARQRFLYHEFDRRLRSHLPAAGMGVDRAKTFFVAIDGSGAAKVP